MKKLILIAVIFLLAGYVLGSFFPVNLGGSGEERREFSLPQLIKRGIEGDAQVEIILLMDTGTPLANVEVDLAEEPGPPPIGGVSLTDENGIAVFNVKPGNYFVFFNDINFPQNLKTPEAQPIEVKEGIVNQKTITLTTR